MFRVDNYPTSKPTRPSMPTSGPPRNVLFFGESGAGKSSVINMLSGFNAAKTSSGATGCTFLSTPYDVDIEGTPFRLHDTAGMDEGDQGRVPKTEAIVQLYRLLKNMEGGVSLLVFCMKAPRVKESASSNWKLFHEIICDRKVPIVIVITGLEQEENMDAWWDVNEDAFRRYEMFGAGHACITAIKGRQKKNGCFLLQDEYDESKGKVEKMIKATYLEVPWRMNHIQWFNKTIWGTTYETRRCRSPVEHKYVVSETKGAVNQLVSRVGMSQEDANNLASMLDRA